MRRRVSFERVQSPDYPLLRAAWLRRGFISILTAFFVVIIIVVALIAFFSFYSIVTGVKGTTKQRDDLFATASSFKDQLLLCHEKTQLSEAQLEEPPCVALTMVKGFSVMQSGALGCEAKRWSFGSTTDIENRVVYSLAVIQNATGRSCAAKLFIYPATGLE
jgi:hypothetical protein